MSAKDDLYRQISACYHHESEGFTTQDCERFTSASRSVISLYLNQLCDEGFLRKENTRPVRFWLSEPRLTAAPQRPEQDVFRALIGATGSLKSALELCLAVVNYPDGGLPILVTGASGVGKSTSPPCCTATPVKTA